MRLLDNDDIERRSEAQKKTIAGVIAWAFNRLRDASGRDIEELRADYDGIDVTWSWVRTVRGCSMGREFEHVVIPWGVFLSGEDLSDWLIEERRRREEKEERRRAAERLLQEEAESHQRELRDRSEYQRLKAKYGGA
jgi:hypothetical protein